MMLVEQTPVPLAALPVAEFKDHLRLGTGFADDGLQDAVLETCLRGALGALEARTGKAILQRGFRWTLAAWRDLSAQVLPVAPVAAITGLSITDRDGGASVIDPGRYRLEVDLHRPRLVSVSLVLPTIPVGGAAEISFDAGFDVAWSGVPSDLAQAVLMLAARFYEFRDGDAEMAIPQSVAMLSERYRVPRLFGGGRA
ncbi:MAG: hypothetical protein HUJ27_14490 [Rhodobacteraceae bacterium]|nr:hypothetical protein [Paracoccaceae bacterium]